MKGQEKRYTDSKRDERRAKIMKGLKNYEATAKKKKKERIAKQT